MFSLVIMTEPYASHDASEIEPFSPSLDNDVRIKRLSCGAHTH